MVGGRKHRARLDNQFVKSEPPRPSIDPKATVEEDDPGKRRFSISITNGKKSFGSSSIPSLTTADI